MIDLPALREALRLIEQGLPDLDEPMDARERALDLITHRVPALLDEVERLRALWDAEHATVMRLGAERDEHRDDAAKLQADLAAARIAREQDTLAFQHALAEKDAELEAARAEELATHRALDATLEYLRDVKADLAAARAVLDSCADLGITYPHMDTNLIDLMANRAAWLKWQGRSR